MKTGRDIKFVIYQVLYIFVICVIALKGADIDLQSVTNIKDAEPKEVADKLRKQIDSLMKLVVVDSLPVIDTTKLYTQAEMDKILAMLKPQTTDQNPGDRKIGITNEEYAVYKAILKTWTSEVDILSIKNQVCL